MKIMTNEEAEERLCPFAFCSQTKPRERCQTRHCMAWIDVTKETIVLDNNEDQTVYAVTKIHAPSGFCDRLGLTDGDITK